MAYSDTIWNAGYMAGRDASLSEAEKLAFALQAILLVSDEAEIERVNQVDEWWLIAQMRQIAKNYLKEYEKSKDEGKAAGEDFPQTAS